MGTQAPHSTRSPSIRLPQEALSDSLDAFAEHAVARNVGQPAKRFAQSGMTVDHKNMQTLCWANNLRERGAALPNERPRTVTPTRARGASLSPGRSRRLRSASPRSMSPYRQDDSLPSNRWGSHSPRSESPASHSARSRAPRTIFEQRSGRRISSAASQRSSSPRSTQSHRDSQPSAMRHGTPPKFFGDAPRIPKLKSSAYMYSPGSRRLSSGGRMSTTRTGARQCKRGNSSSSWLHDEENKISETFKECNRETQREWLRMQRSHPELKKVPMPTFGGSHDKMWTEVKWMLKRKVDEQDARAKRMTLRIQSLEADAEKARQRRVDLERVLSRMTKTHDKELESWENRLQQESSSLVALKKEKDILLDELDKRCTELEHLQTSVRDLKVAEESLKTALAISETDTAELKRELNLLRRALEEEQGRARNVERERTGEEVEGKVKIEMMDKQLNEMRQLSADMERELERLRDEVANAHEQTEAEKRRSTKAINDMSKKLSVWSEEGALAIQEARLAAEDAEKRAKAHEREVERDAKGTLHDLEIRVEAQTEQLRREAEKARREERNDLLRKAASEKIALEAKYKAEIENLRADMERKVSEERSKMDCELKREITKHESRLKAETDKYNANLDAEIEKHKRGLAAVQSDMETARRLADEKVEFRLNSEADRHNIELAAVRRELAAAQQALQEADEKHDEYEKVLEAATESHEAMKSSRDQTQRASSVAKEDIKMLKKMVSTLQVELAEEKKDNLVCQQQIEDLTRRLQVMKEKDWQVEKGRELEKDLKERALEKEREKIVEWERQRRKERDRERKERERERETAREREREFEREREAEQQRQNDELKDEIWRLKRDRKLEDEPSPEKGMVAKEQSGEASKSGEKKNNFWDGSDFMMATETSFEKMQKKMKEIQEVVSGLDSAKKDDKKNDSGHDHSTDTVVRAVRRASVSASSQGLNESVTFERMKKKMDEISRWASLDSVWDDAEETAGDHFQHAQGEQSSASGWKVGDDSPKKRVAARHHAQRAYRADTVAMGTGAVCSEIVQRSPFRPIPPPRDPRLEKVFGEIDTLQSEWKGPRPRPSAGNRALQLAENTTPQRSEIQLTLSEEDKAISNSTRQPIELPGSPDLPRSLKHMVRMRSPLRQDAGVAGLRCSPDLGRLQVRTEESDESEEESALLLQRKWEVKRQLHRASAVKSTSPTNKIVRRDLEDLRRIRLTFAEKSHAHA